MNPQHLTLIILAINALAYVVVWLDKKSARHGGWRVPEANLLGLALLGGVVGLWLGMRRFRHKTSKQSFRLKLAAIVALQVVAAIYYLTQPI